jgi:hypothetical protein
MNHVFIDFFPSPSNIPGTFKPRSLYNFTGTFIKSGLSSMTEENEYIHRVLNGDTDAFRFLVKKYEKPIIAMISNFMTNRHNCEDVAQDVFLLAASLPEKVDHQTPFRQAAQSEFFDRLNQALNALPAGEKSAFVLADNRNQAKDSRAYGPIPYAALKGRADYLYFSLQNWSRLGKLNPR